MDIERLSETAIITKLALPANEAVDWNSMLQIGQEVKLRDGRGIVRRQISARKTDKSADIVFYRKPNMSLAVIEFKANKHEASKGM